MFFYSHYPLEQAAYDHVVKSNALVLAELAKKPANYLTTPILGHTYWIADGELYAYPGAILQGEWLSPDNLDDAFTVNEIDGLGVNELKDIADANMRWLENPQFITVPEGSQMISENRRQLRQEFPPKVPYTEDYRVGRASLLEAVGVPEGPCSTLTIQQENSSMTAKIIAVDGEQLCEPLDFTLMNSKSMASVGYRVLSLTLSVPHTKALGAPSAFKEGWLDHNDVVAHLAHGLHLSPFNISTTATTEVFATYLEGDTYSLIATLQVPTHALSSILGNRETDLNRLGDRD